MYGINMILCKKDKINIIYYNRFYTYVFDYRSSNTLVYLLHSYILSSCRSYNIPGTRLIKSSGNMTNIVVLLNVYGNFNLIYQ